MSNQFYASQRVIRALIQARDDFDKAKSVFEATLQAANGRTLVLPKLWGGFLPGLLRGSGIEVVEDRAAFEAAREAAVEAIRAKRDERVLRMLPNCQSDVVRFSPEEAEQRRLKRLECERKRQKRRQDDARLRLQMQSSSRNTDVPA